MFALAVPRRAVGQMYRIPGLLQLTCLQSHRPSFTREQVATICEAPLALHELKAALQRTRRRSAPGADVIPPQMLRNLGTNRQQRLLDCYNQVWQTNGVLESWHLAVVAPTLEKRKPARELSSYRLGCLTSAACKVVEAIALVRLEWVARATGFLANQQTGAQQMHHRLHC
ncbi:hypothetical protein MTO96_019500 [Rhipicephalus appendiculatus]